MRQRWFDRQIETGVIPAGPPSLRLETRASKLGTTLPENQKRFACLPGLQEAFAAFLDHTDDQIGRLVDGLREHGRARQHDLRHVLADNGASQEGGRSVCMHEMKFFNGLLEDPRRRDRPPRRHRWSALAHELPVGLGPVSATAPFKWYKQNTHEGGVHVPMVLHWPSEGIDAAAGREPNATSLSTSLTSHPRSMSSSAWHQCS